MLERFFRLFLTLILFSGGMSAHADLPATFEETIELHRKIIFLIEAETDNAAAREHNVFIARNFYVQKREHLEALENSVLNDPAQARVIVDALIRFSNDTQTHAADMLAFLDLFDAIQYRQAEQPFLSTDQLNFLRQLEEQMQLIQKNYSKDMAEISAALSTRGLTLEPWQDYLNFLETHYDINQIQSNFNQAKELLAKPATRGMASSKDSPSLIWGFGLPEKTVVLTFDDGPHYRNTNQILDILKQYQVSGYFFAVGKNIGTIGIDGKPTLAKSAATLQRAVQEGHILANHSFSHQVLTKLDSDTQSHELGDTNLLLSAVAGQATQLFRPPYGSQNDVLLARATELGMRAVLWNIDSLDWANPVPDSIVQHVLGELEKSHRGILLFHDIHKQTVQALPAILTALKANGYRAVTVDGQDFAAPHASTESTIANTAPVPPAPALYNDSWAMVVGINQYQHWPQLSYAVHDAKSVGDLLRQQYGFKADHVFELYDTNATREKISDLLTNTLADPARIKPDDRVFIFFAGHGMTRSLPSGRNLGYIIPVDAGLDTFASTSISMTHLQDFSDMIPAKHVYFIMDSCYSGIALTRGGVADSRYLGEIANRRARQILTAGGASQEVADGGPEGHSIFTWSLLQGLKGEADLDHNHIITASELGAFIAPKVSENSNQTPAFGNLVGNEGGDFLFELSLPGEGNQARTDLPSSLPPQQPGEAEKLRVALAAMEQDNAALKQQLASLQQQDQPATKQQLRSAAQDLIQLSPIQRKQIANEWHRQGLDLYKANQLKPALDAMHQAITFGPDNVGIVNDYGFMLYRNREFEQALTWLEKTIEMDGERIPVYLNIADTMVELERISDAVPYYKYYLERYPDSPVKPRIDAFLQAHP